MPGRTPGGGAVRRSAGSGGSRRNGVRRDYWSGRTDDALRRAEDIVGEIEAGTSHRMELDARLIRGWIRLERGEVTEAQDDAGRALEFARAAGDPEALFPALAFAARVAVAAGHEAEGKAIVDELLRSWTSGNSRSFGGLADLGIVAHDVGRSDELFRVASTKTATRWLDGRARRGEGPVHAGKRTLSRDRFGSRRGKRSTARVTITSALRTRCWRRRKDSRRRPQAPRLYEPDGPLTEAPCDLIEVPVGVVSLGVVDERMDPSCRVLADGPELAGTTDAFHAISYVPGRLLRRRGSDVIAMRHDTIIADCAIGCKAMSWMPRKGRG